MNDIAMYKMLITIKEQKNLQSLFRIGMTYKQIADFTKQVSQDGLVELTDSGIILTRNGEDLLQELTLINKKTNKNEWIEAEESARIEKISKDFIFLPSQTDPLL